MTVNFGRDKKRPSQGSSFFAAWIPIRALAPVAETDFSHRLTAYKIMDISLDCHIRKYLGVIRSKIVFLESVTFKFHARMLSSEVAQ